MSNNNNNEITPLPAISRTGSFAHVDLNEKSEKHEITHIEDDEATIRGTGDGKPHYTAADAKHSVGLALIDQVNTIPSAGDRIVTTKREYWSYVAFGQCPLSFSVGADGQLSVLMGLGLGPMEVLSSRRFCISNSQVGGSSGEEVI
jgi:hypothetical protein